MNTNFFNVMNKVLPQSSNYNGASSSEACKPKKSSSMQFSIPSSFISDRVPTSISFDSIKSQTARVSQGVLSSIKDNSLRVSQYISNARPLSPEDNIDKKVPSIFEQLKWPNLSLDNRLKKHSMGSLDEEESIVDRFVRVIQSEDVEENPETTFFNHPTRV